LRSLAFMVIAVALAGDNALGQEVTNAPASTPTGTRPDVTKEVEDKAWSFAVSAATYIVPSDQEYAQPTLTADRDRLHLEARYNYESLKTGSVWVGYNLSGGEKLEWEFKPMLGGVFGNTTGIAPGYKGSLSWWKLELYSEGEYVFDTGNSAGSFFYSWSEFSVSPADWFRLGLAGQRTRAYQSKVDLQRGLLMGFSYKEMGLTTYVFNLDRGRPTWVFSVGVSF
jgi:hypothetical protein